MAKSKKKIIEDVVEEFNWSVSFETQENCATGKMEKYASFRGYSEAGEDLEFTEFYNGLDELPEKLFERYQDFDTEEHVKMWLEAKSNGVRGVPDVETLVKNANWLKSFLLEMAEALRDALAGRKPKKKESGDEKPQQLLNLIDQRDRIHHGAYEAWDTVNRLVNEVYGIDLGDALALWEQKGAREYENRK